MNKKILALLLSALAPAAFGQITVTKTSGTNVVDNGPIVIGSGNSVTFLSGSSLNLENGASLGNALPWSALSGIPSPAFVASGDASGNGTLSASGPGALPLTLAVSGVTAGTYGDATHVPQFAVDAKGRVTGVTSVAIAETGVLLTANNLSELVGSASTARGNLGVAIGTNVEAWSVTLDSFASAGNAPSYYLNAANLTGTLPAARLPAFTGDATAPGGSAALTLASTAVSAGSYGDASHVGTFTVDAKGRLTAASNAAIAITEPWTSLSGVPNSVWTLTGDVTGTITTSALASASGGTTLANSGVTSGTYGSATQSLTATVDSKGRVTALSAQTVTPPWSSISGNPISVTALKTVVFSNTLTFAGTDGATLNVGAGGSLGSAAFTGSGSYAPPTSGSAILYGNGSGGFSNVTVGSNLSFNAGTLAYSGPLGGGTVLSVGSGTGLTGGPITSSGSLSISSAYAGNGIGTVNGLAYGNGSGTITSVTVGSGLVLAGGSISLPTSIASMGVTNGSTIDSWGTKTVPAGTVADLSSAQAFTNKTIAGGSNTITGIGNTSLTNSSITIAGSATALGGSITLDGITGLSTTGLVKRTGANTLAIATADTDYSTPAGTETLTNKTYDTAGTGNVFDVNGRGITGYSGTNNTVALTGSPAFSGTPTTPNASALTDNTQVANTAYVDSAVAAAQLMTINNQGSGTYTLQLSDANALIRHPSADTNARSWVIPANASVAFPIGTVVSFYNQPSAGTITLSITSDTLTTANSGATGAVTILAGHTASMVKDASTSWILNLN